MNKNDQYLTPAEKAALTRKWRVAFALSHERARNAILFAKYALRKRGYRCVSFLTPRGYEYKGVVDLVAIRRRPDDPDRLEILFVQVKGGGARVSANEITRIKRAVKIARLDWDVAEKPGSTVVFWRESRSVMKRSPRRR